MPPKLDNLTPTPPVEKPKSLDIQILEKLQAVLTQEKIKDLLVHITIASNDIPVEKTNLFLSTVRQALMLRFLHNEMFSINLAVDTQNGNASKIDKQEGEAFEIIATWVGDELREVLEDCLRGSGFLESKESLTSGSYVKPKVFSEVVRSLIREIFSKIETSHTETHMIVRDWLGFSNNR